MTKIYLAAGLAAGLFLGGCNFQGSIDTEESEQAVEEVTVERTVVEEAEPEPGETAVVEVVQPPPDIEYDAPEPAPPTNVSVERNTTVVVPARSTPPPPKTMPRGNDISCPPGSQANAAGTRCTNMSSGKEAQPNWQVTGPGETSATNPCPEMMKKDGSGKCVAIQPPPKSKGLQP